MIEKLKINKYIVLISLFILYTNFGFCQISGSCTDIFGNPIPYINISVNKSIVGTVSDENGIFQFKENLIHFNDTLFFTHIGYETQNIDTDVAMHGRC